MLVRIAIDGRPDQTATKPEGAVGFRSRLFVLSVGPGYIGSV